MKIKKSARAFSKSRIMLICSMLISQIHFGAQPLRAADSSLLTAAKQGNTNTVKILLDNGADPNQTGFNADSFNWTPLHWAAFRGDLNIVNMLLGSGAEPNRADTFEWTPLHWATRNGHNKVVKALLTAGANANSVASLGQTALSFAAERGREDIVKLLLRAGAQIDREGWFIRLSPRAQELINKHQNILLERKTALEEACEYQAQRLPACATRSQGLIRDLRWLIEEFEGTRPLKPQRAFLEEQPETQGSSKRQRTH